MPKTAFNEDELDQLLNSVFTNDGRSKAEQLLEPCHEYVSSSDPTGRWLQPYERFFRKEIIYHDFELHVRHFMCDGNAVVAADIQFKRPSRFPAPLLNRNRTLVNRLRRFLREIYGSPGIEVKDERGGRQMHFNVSSNPLFWDASTSFEDWQSEVALYDEPCSSGQTDPEQTRIRNDFVILRFRRR